MSSHDWMEGEEPQKDTLGLDSYHWLKYEIGERIFPSPGRKELRDKSKDELRKQAEELLGKELVKSGISLSRKERDQLIADLVDEISGLGPIEPLLNDPTISRIVVNHPWQVMVERQGNVERADRQFKDEAHLLDIIERIAFILETKVDQSIPKLNRELSEGSRVRVIIPPLGGPFLAIDKGKENPFSLLAKSKEEEQITKPETYYNIKYRVLERLLREIDEELLEGGKREELQGQVEELTSSTLSEDGLLLSQPERERLVSELLDEMLGYGALEPLLNDPSITEIMVNDPEHVYIERGGKLEKTPIRLRDDKHILRIIDKIILPIGRRIDWSSPMVDARLPDGSRVNAIIPPLALAGPTLTIRKFSEEPFTIEDLINFGTLSSTVAEFLEACVKGRVNTIISGGTGVGKTTTLNVLSSFLPQNERIITIEETAELQLSKQEHLISLEARPPNIEGKGEVTIWSLLRNALHMRPNRIVIGEVRGGEALDMLQAMNTGHDGSLCTIHANSPRDVVSRLETMVLMAGVELPIKAIRSQIVSAINLIVHQHRFPDGSRKITRIAEIKEMEEDVITLQDIFRFEQREIDQQGRILGRLKPTGVRPRLLEKLELAGVHLPSEIFTSGEE